MSDITTLARILAGIDSDGNDGNSATAAWSELLSSTQHAARHLAGEWQREYQTLHEGVDQSGRQAQRIERLLSLMPESAIENANQWLNAGDDLAGDDNLPDVPGEIDGSADEWLIRDPFDDADAVQFGGLFDEDQHPRDDDGTFTEKSGGGKSRASIADEAFKLTNARKGKQRFANDKTKQKKLLEGMDALPGQQDLFEGEPHASAKLPIERETYTTFKHPEEGYIDLRRIALHGPPRQPHYELVETYKDEHHSTPVLDEAHGRKLLAKRIEELTNGGWRKNERDAQFATSGDKPAKKASGAGDGKWVTIGGHPEAGKKHVGGVRVLIRGGKIVGGPERLRGRTLSSFSEGKPSDSKLAAVVRKAAKEHGLPKKDLHGAIHLVHEERTRTHNERERAKQAAREATNLTARDISRLSNSGHDYSSGKRAGGATGEKLKHLDAVGQELARTYPEFLGDPDNPRENFAERLWGLLSEGRREAPAKHHDETVQQAVNLLKSSRPMKKADKQRYEEMQAIPFSLSAGSRPDRGGAGRGRLPRLLER